MRNVLTQRPSLLGSERNICGHTAIHLAIGWPEGLKILLEVADEAVWEFVLDGDLHSQHWSTPLDFAIAFGCVESIRLLSHANIAFNLSWSYRVGTSTLDPRVSEIVLTLILERFQQLHDFSLQNLPAGAVRALEIERLEFFDSKIRSLYYYFEQHHISIPRKFRGYTAPDFQWFYKDIEYFCPRFGGLFHQPILSPDTAKAFFDAGIRGVDCEVKHITPLMVVAPPNFANQIEFISLFFGIVEFLISKGARLDREIYSEHIKGKTTVDCDTQRRHRVVHRIAALAWRGSLGPHAFYLINFGIENAVMTSNLGSSEIWRRILGDSASDPCSCACSTDGCRPISLALKNAFGDGYWKNSFVSKKQNQETQHTSIFESLVILLESIEGEQIEKDVIRFLTFSVLGLTHTCCEHEHCCILEPRTEISPLIYLMDEDEIHDIHDEEAQLIERLDYLVDEFMKQCHVLGLPLTTFLREHWQPRMQAEILVPDNVLKEEKERLEKLGIRILEDETDTEMCNDGLNPDNGYDSYDEWIENIAKTIKLKKLGLCER